MAFDRATGQLVVVTRDNNSAECASQTSTWDGSNWSRHLVDTAPGARDLPALAYDAATKQLVLFGGFGTPTCDDLYWGSLNDTWTWNGSVWTLRQTGNAGGAPRAATGACAAYDEDSRQLLMFGGIDAFPTSAGEPLDDTWEWTGTGWQQMAPATTPPAGPCTMTYDAARKVLVMLTYDITALGDVAQTWIWNGSDWNRAADFPVKSASYPGIAFDTDTQSSIVYVGSGAPCADVCTALNQTWSWDGTGWTKLATTSPTAAAEETAAAYDAATHQLVMYGGWNSAANASTRTTWLFAAPGGSAVAPVRIAGPNRQATAVAASHEAFPTANSASAVVLARADVFADALAGGPLAATKHAPLLLTSSGDLDDVTAAEIRRVLPAGGTVYLLGGTSALSEAVASAVSKLGDTPQRLAGDDRFATAVAIAHGMGDPATVFEASGTNFPDALSAVPAAISEHAAILLTNGSEQAPASAGYLAAHATTRYAVGGPAAWADPSAVALAGADRYATSQAVALAFFPDAAGVGVASGASFPDALSAGPVAGAVSQPVLLVPGSGTLPGPIDAYLSTHALTLTTVRAFGGASAMSDGVLAEVAAAIRP